MSEQEQEHWDHVADCASELQNCFSEAQSAANHQAADYRKAIDEVLAAGRFAVVLRCPYYCKATDAVAGSVEYLRGSFATRDEAYVAANAIHAAEGLDSCEDLYILPAAELPVQSPAVADDGVPF